MDQPSENHPGAQLRDLRRDRGISQRHLAEELGVDQSEISKIERGADACWTTLLRLFAGLGYDIALTAQPSAGEDDVEDFLQDGIQRRRDRMEKGRMSRW
jgi:transcriptional regulator with XRE-family HTH domain